MDKIPQNGAASQLQEAGSRTLPAGSPRTSVESDYGYVCGLK